MDTTKKKIGWFLYDENNKRVLLHRRDHRAKESPDTWDCFGGGVENNGESEQEAFLRELYEELGIIIKKDNVDKLSVAGEVYYCIPFSMQETSRIRLGEGAGFAWFPLEYIIDLPDITNDARKVLESFKATDLGKKFINNNK